MDILQVHQSLTPTDPSAVLVAAIDGWTDAGSGGSSAAAVLTSAFATTRLASFDPDVLYDFRDRRPELNIDKGVLGEMTWPALTLDLVEPPAGPPLVLLTGAEPDLSWHKITTRLIEYVAAANITRYVGLGSVPGPIPHTRPVHVICTGTDEQLLERIGRPHERVVVPASFQVALEKRLADAGAETLGLWVRIPHYVAGDYPQASRALLEQLSAQIGTPVDLAAFDEAVEENRARLDLAASSSQEVTEHVQQLEQLYDAESQAGRITGAPRDVALSEEDVPTADEIAAEIERFLRGRAP